ncbi:MAG: CPBP family glutamic-type intramembrane protease [Planctomycetota bacterium]
MRISSKVLGIELLQLARDRRALFSAIVLPALLYPLFFWGSSKLEEVGETTMKSRDLVVHVDLTRADEALEAELLAALPTEDGATEFRPVDAAPMFALSGADADGGEPSALVAEAPDPEEQQRLAARELIGLDEGGDSDPADLLLVGANLGGDAERYGFELWYDVKSDDAREARSRIRAALRELEKTETIARRERLLGGDPALGLDATSVDVASEEDASGARLGKWLPFVALLVLVSGGAYAALAVFAGEREAGTLETLLVQPVPPRAIATGKFLAVFVAGMATLVVNLGSLLACVGLGIGDFDAVTGGSFSMARLAWMGLELPACLLLTAVLCVVCGGARTFREGQMLIFPVTLLVIVPTSIVLQPEASLDPLWACVPFAGAALGLRDGLEGDLSLPLAALVVASHLGWTWLALGRLAGVLDAERVLGSDSKAELAQRQAAGRHAKGWGFAVVMSVYLVAGWVQRADLEAGLWFTFWVLLPAFALAIAWWVPREEGEPRRLTRELGLTLPRPLVLVGGLLCVPALVKGAMALLAWQSEVLPLPGGMDAMSSPLAGLPTWQLVFFLAVSPALMEELVFRGSLLSAMRRDWRWPRIVLWQAIFFALVHMSIYRLLPTGILGALLAALTLRARSVVPAILVHGTYNLLVVGSGAAESDPESALARALAFTDAAWWQHAPWAAIAGVLLIAAGGRERGAAGA